MEMKYFEIQFGPEEDYKNQEWMVIRGVREPSIEEANKFCEYEVKMWGKPVTDVWELDELTARSLYDFSNEANWPIFGVNNKKEENTMKNVKLTLNLTIDDTPEALDAIQRITHHAEWFLNLEDYPEVKEVYGVKVEVLN